MWYVRYQYAGSYHERQPGNERRGKHGSKRQHSRQRWWNRQQYSRSGNWRSGEHASCLVGVTKPA